MTRWTSKLLWLSCLLLPILHVADTSAEDGINVQKCESIFQGYTKMALLENACRWDQEYSVLYRLGIEKKCSDYISSDKKRSQKLVNQVGFAMNDGIERLGIHQYCARSRDWYDTVSSVLREASGK